MNPFSCEACGNYCEETTEKEHFYWVETWLGEEGPLTAYWLKGVRLAAEAGVDIDDAIYQLSEAGMDVDEHVALLVGMRDLRAGEDFALKEVA